MFWGSGRGSGRVRSDRVARASHLLPHVGRALRVHHLRERMAVEGDLAHCTPQLTWVVTVIHTAKGGRWCGGAVVRWCGGVGVRADMRKCGCAGTQTLRAGVRWAGRTGCSAFSVERQEVEQRGLARTARAHDGEHVAGAHLARDAAEQRSILAWLCPFCECIGRFPRLSHFHHVDHVLEDKSHATTGVGGQCGLGLRRLDIVARYCARRGRVSAHAAAWVAAGGPL